KTDFLVGDALRIANISLYAYTHVAHEGGFDLSSYASIGKWLERIEQHSNYFAMNS
ncbi:MAG: glutathione S-transferase family protein, partial [Gammaproteobacteria bacterium]